jgi:nucleoside-triphosphatase THEP1
MTGKTTVNSKLHQNIIKNIRNAGFLMLQVNQSGRIKSFRQSALPKYIGPLSRMHKRNPQKYLMNSSPVLNHNEAY